MDTSALDEEMARAELYGLLATLYCAPPDPQWLARMRAAATDVPSEGGALEAPWRVLVDAARAVGDAAIAAEYATLFGGHGKPAISLSRAHGMLEAEDHIASLCETMHYLIVGDDAAVCDLARQQDFFNTHLLPWVPSLCDALQAHPEARFYAALAGLTRAFLAIEAQGFDMLE